MKLFRNYTFTWWQAGLLKLCMLSIGIAIGAYWWDFFVDYVAWFLGAGIILGLYLAYVSFK